ncbi:MAG: SH3 domain-containing protein [Saprospiraceae bacterium]
MKIFRILSAIAIVAVIQSCQSDSKPGSIPKPTAVNEAPVTPRPSVYLYMVMVDNLNLREQPNKSGRVIVRFPEGSFVEGTGVISDNKEEATLRGIPYNEPYFQVKTSDNQNIGWAYSAALKPVYTGAISTRPDLNRLSKLSAFLKTLDVTKLENGGKAIEFVKTNYASSSGTLADAVFVMLENFLSTMEREGMFYRETEDFTWTDSDFEDIFQDRFDMNKYPLTKKYGQNGFRMEAAEGSVFPVVDWFKLGDFFVGRVTPPMKEYLEQYIAELKSYAYDDGGIVIGLDTIAQRAIFWEKFNQMNPYFVRGYETKETERWLRMVLVSGTDNTPVFDYDNNKITDDFKKVWAIILDKYPGTKLAKTVKEFSDLCAAEGGKRTQKVEDWQNNFANRTGE